MFQMFKNKIKALNSLRGLKNGKSYVYSYSRVHIDNILHSRVQKIDYVYSYSFLGRIEIFGELEGCLGDKT